MPNTGQEQTGNPGGGNNGRHYLSPDSGGCIDKSPSLQRIHQQSSTETSGLGASEFSSRESIHSNQSFNDHKCDHGHLVRYKHAMVVPKEQKNLVSKSNPETKKEISPDTEVKTMFSDGPNFDDLFNQSRNTKTNSFDTGQNGNYRPRRLNYDRNHNPGQHIVDDNSSHNQSQPENYRPRRPRSRSHKLEIEDENYEWTRKGSKGSIKSHTSRGSFRSRSGSCKYKLGHDFDSAWMKWGRARRESYQRKLEVPENEPIERERATTPIKKARQELIAQFVHPDLTEKYISEDDINYIRRHRQRQYQTYHAIEKTKKNKRLLSTHSDIYLNAREWKILSSFWKHKVFRRSRYFSLFFVIISIIILSVSVASKKWIIYNTSDDVDIYEGMWESCVENRTISNLHYSECTHNIRDWQNAVIGLMIFAASIGFLAAILAVLGVCTSPLPKKIYYFHSAGEIFLVCAMAATVALVIYPAGIEMDKSIASHYYGSGYGLGWGSAFFFLCAALCMSLDDLVRESAKAKCCRLCFKRDRSDGTESQQV